MLLLLILLLLPLVGALVVAPLPATRARPSWPRWASRWPSWCSPPSPGSPTRSPPPRPAPGSSSSSRVDWIPAFGTRFALGIDGIALVMLALIAVLVPIVMGVLLGREAAGGAHRGRVLRAAAGHPGPAGRGVRGHRRVPVLRVLRGHAGPDVLPDRPLRRAAPAVRGGEVLPLLAARRADHAGLGDRAVRGQRRPAGRGHVHLGRPAARSPRRVPESTQIWLFLGFFVAFAIKAPLVPFHTWLPDAGAEAPVGAGVLLVGVLDKVGTFGFLRYCLPLFPLASQRARAAGAHPRRDRHPVRRAARRRADRHEAVRRLHLDRPLRVHRARASSRSPRRRSPAPSLYMVNHGISTGMLFIVVGMLIARGGSRLIGDYGGVRKLAPLLAGHVPAAGRAVVAGAARHQLVRQRVPGAGRLVPARAGLHDPGHGRDHLRRAVRAVGLPAHDAGPGARRRGARRAGAGGAAARAPMLDPAVAAEARAAPGSPTCRGARSPC